MVAVVVMVLDVEAKSGEGEGEGQDWGATELKQASSELPGFLFSTVMVPKRSRPEDAVLALPSEGAKGSLVKRQGGKCNKWRGGMLDNDNDTKQSRHICFM